MTLTEPVVPTATAAPKERHPVVPLVGLTAGLGAVLVALLALFILPSLKSGPRDLPLGLVGDAAVVADVQSALATDAPGAYAPRPLTSEAELRSLYSRATVFAIASIAELQSIATMEAMASGLPIVAADAVALPHLVHDGENGYLFTPGDADELAARLTDVLTANPEDRLRMQQASLDGVIIHDINRTLDTFEALYRGEPLPE